MADGNVYIGAQGERQQNTALFLRARFLRVGACRAPNREMGGHLFEGMLLRSGGLSV